MFEIITVTLILIISFLQIRAHQAEVRIVHKFICDIIFYGEFDPGSERTLAAWIRHASRTRSSSLLEWIVAKG